MIAHDKMDDPSCPAVFNLIEAAWLPVQRRSGAVERISPWQLNDLIDEDPFIALAWPRPDFNGAALEFLIGLLATAAAPESDEDWEEWWVSPPTPDVLQKRFSCIAGPFDLDGSGPIFLQDLDPLEGAEQRQVSRLLIDAPGENTLRNNGDLFVKRGEAPVMARATAAMALYTLSSYAPTGGVGHRTSLRGGGPLTTLAIASSPDYGDTLWGRLWPNVESQEQINARSAESTVSNDADTVFPWLAPTRTSNPKEGGRATTPADVHPLQVYWGMPRRIRLQFEAARDRLCSVTGEADSVVVTTFRTRNYGTNYSDGFEHPLTPYYRQKVGKPKLPVHPGPGGISYRHWPGFVVRSRDRLRDPAQVVRNMPDKNLLLGHGTRFMAFGFDMDNMKARAWIESEMPVWILADVTARDLLQSFVEYATAGAGTAAWCLVRAVKSAFHNRPSEAKGDYGFLTDRFYRDTEQGFHAALEAAIGLIEKDGDADDPTVGAREGWSPVLASAALRLFDEYVPADALESRNMQRHVRARFFLASAVAGRGKAGRSFYADLGISHRTP